MKPECQMCEEEEATVHVFMEQYDGLYVCGRCYASILKNYRCQHMDLTGETDE